MTPRAFLALIVVLTGWSTPSAFADDWGRGNARVWLVADDHRSEPAQPTLVGVRFEIRPGWHIYWRNPGGAGMATEIRWRLPADTAAAAIQWPLPIAFTQSGDIPGYGYEDAVVLASELGGAPLADDATVGASVSWLACKDVCVLGSAELEARWSDIPRDAVFSRWQSILPAQWSREEAPFSHTTTGGLGFGVLTLWLQWRQPPGAVDWFPDPPEGLVVDDIAIQTRGDLSRIDASVRRMAGAEGVFDTLPSVVAVTDKHGERRGWNLAVELTDDNS